MLVAAAHIDLARHARALDGLSDWTTHTVQGGAFRNLARLAKHEQRVIDQVRSAAEQTPEAFTGAADVERGVTLLNRATNHLQEARAAVSAEVAPSVETASRLPGRGKPGRDVTAATIPFFAAASDLREAHRLLGGTRSLPPLQRGPAIALEARDVAPATASAVRSRGHQQIQWAIHRFFDAGAAKALGIRAHGARNVPAEGGVIIAPNHGSMRDPFYHARAIDRPVRFIANAKWWDKPVLGKAMQLAGAYPVKPGDAHAGLAVERGVLRSGQATTHYAEGMLVHGDLIGSHADGLAQVALETRVPVVPVGAYGDNKSRLLRGSDGGRPMVEVVYGKPIHLAGAPATPENIALVRERVARAQEGLTEQARQLYTERRAASEAAVPR